MHSLRNLLQAGFAFIAIPAMLFTSCQREDSADVNQARIYTHYELFYNANDDKTHAVARFRFGNATGTLLELNSPAEVSFNGQVMAYNALYSGHHLEFAGRIASGTFIYTDTDGAVLQNNVAPYDSIAFPADLDTISKSQAYTLAWDGSPLAPNENVGIFIGSWTWGQDALFLQAQDNATNIVMGTNALGNLSTGPSIFYMDRWTQVAPTQATEAGGVVIGKHRAQNVQVQVID